MPAVPGWRRCARPLVTLHLEVHHGPTKLCTGAGKAPSGEAVRSVRPYRGHKHWWVSGLVIFNPMR